MSDRLRTLIDTLTIDTLLGAILAPVNDALAYCRSDTGRFRTVSMFDFIALGALRHLKCIRTSREYIQSLAHEVDQVSRPPLARSTWGDALGSAERTKVLGECVSALVRRTAATVPDRFAGLSSVGERAVYAVDGSYQHESAHFRRRTRADGGEDNTKGHCLLCFFDLRIACMLDVKVETRSRHEMPLLREYDEQEHALTRQRNALWVLDRAYIDASWWDEKKHRLGATMITRLREDLSIESNELLPIKPSSRNKGVISDERITLNSSGEYWRLITYRTRRGRTVKFLSNDFSLLPGEIAFIYSRRWEEEKAFDVWKNDWGMAKAWGKSKTSTTNQVLLAIITGLLLAIFLHEHGCGGDADSKSLRKQAARSAGSDGGTDRPEWTESVYRFTSRLSKQLLRFIRCCYRRPMTPELIERQLRPLLQCYL